MQRSLEEMQKELAAEIFLDPLLPKQTFCGRADRRKFEEHRLRQRRFLLRSSRFGDEERQQTVEREEGMSK